MTVEASSLDLLDEDVIGLTSDRDLLRGDFAENANSDSRAGEGVPPDEILRNAKVGSEDADLVFEELAEGLDELEFHVLQETTDVL